MLQTSVGIFSPASSGGGEYTFQLFFELSAEAKFLRVGDTVEDSTGNQYEVLSWTTQPSDFASGDTVTVSFITADVLPQVDSGFDSLAFTPGQEDLRPVFQTPGTLFNINFFSGQTFEYELQASWSQGSEAAQAVVGDRIVDATGKEYEITFIDTGRFSDPFRMKEVEPIGVTPSSGAATLYRPTDNFEFFQGNELTDPARTVILNRDKQLIDRNLSAGGGSNNVEAPFLNATGGNLSALIPVRQNGSGNMETIDPATESEVSNILGLLKATTANNASGTVVLAGLIQDITTGFAVGDQVFLSKSGGLTNSVPEIGSNSFVEGDFVVYIGQITKNQTSGSNKDILVDIQVRGQL